MSAAQYIKPKPSCEVCGKVFQRPYSLKVHSRIHTGERPYKCSYCERTFRYNSSYSFHVVTAHDPGYNNTECFGNAVESNEIPKQKQKTSTKRSPKLPAPEHGSERSYTCSICQRSFTHNTSLKRHMRLHTETKLSSSGRKTPASSSPNAISGRKVPASGSSNVKSGRKVPASGSSNVASGRKVPASGSSNVTSGRKVPASSLSNVASGRKVPASSSSNVTSGQKVPASSLSNVSSGRKVLLSSSSIVTSGRNVPASSSLNITSGDATADSYLKITSKVVKSLPPAITESSHFKIPKRKPRKGIPNITTASTADTASLKAKEYIGVLICSPSISTASKQRHVHSAAHARINHNISSQRQNNKELEGTVVTGDTRNNLNKDMDTGSTTSNKDVVNDDKNDPKNHPPQTSSPSIQVYKCSKCEVKFSNKEDLKKHMVYHTNGNGKQSGFRCSKCYKVFKLPINLRRHITVAHSKLPKQNYQYRDKDGKVYECSICKRKLHSITAFTKHKRLHKKFYQCTVCKACFDTKDAQTLHSKSSHVRERPHKCPYCDWKFTQKAAQKRHIKMKHKKLKTSFTCDIDRSRTKSVSKGYSCKQCSSYFAKEYLLRKHVMKVHWKEDNKLNKIKQMAEIGVRQSAVGPKPTEGTHANKVLRYACDTCGARFTKHHLLNLHIKAKHVDGDLSEETKTSGVYDGKPKSPHVNVSQDMPFKQYEIRYDKQKMELNKAVLSAYYVPLRSLKPTGIDPVTGKNLYNCEVCSNSYIFRESLIRHIRRSAYDHGIYLRKRGDTEYQSHQEESNIAFKTVEGRRFLNDTRSLQPTESALPVKSSPRFRCDVCKKSYTRRYNMFLHRFRHTEEEFKCAGVREDVYKTPDGTIEDIPMSQVLKDPAEHEVSSSTSQNPANSREMERGEASAEVYVDRAEDDMETEPVFFARPYVADETEDTDDYTHSLTIADIQTIADYTQSTDNSQDGDSSQSIDNTQDGDMCIDEQCTVLNTAKVQASAAEHIEITEHINATEHANMKSEINTGENVNTKVTAYSNTGLNTNTLVTKRINSHKQMSSSELQGTSAQLESSVSTVVSHAGSVPLFGDDSTCTTCRVAFVERQNRMKCRLCDQLFCRYCSGIPSDVYNVIFKYEYEWTSGIWWTCHTCKHLVPKFTLLLQQLGDFEQVINNRLSDLEHRVLKMASK